MVVNAAPMTTPTARSMTLPRMMKALNSFSHCGSFTGMCPVILWAKSLMLVPSTQRPIIGTTFDMSFKLIDCFL